MPSKIWRRNDDPDLPIQSNRGSSFTMIGAIDEIRGIRYYTVFQGSNTVANFSDFILELGKTLDGRPAFIVFDNLSVHHSRALRNVVNSLTNLNMVWLPPYSCSLNPIEKLWNLIKI